MNYTEEQKKVFNFVKYDSSHGIIDAVAGSGKTTTIVDSAEYIDPSKKVLFCAFNNSIAREIASRFARKGLNRIITKTLHALGYDLLKSNSGSEFKLENGKYNRLVETLLRGDDVSDLLERLCIINHIPSNPQSNIEEKQLKQFYNLVKAILTDICAKSRLTLTKLENPPFQELIIHFNILNDKKVASTTFTEEVNIYLELTKLLISKGNELAKKLNVIDFSDMLYLPFERGYSPANKFDFLFIDECQDLSKSQLAIATKYVKAGGRILSVGDPYQSIYGFTGADIESFNMIKELPNTVTLNLSKCFRCPTEVIELAQHFRNDIFAFEEKQGLIQWIDFKQVPDFVNHGNLIISRTKAPLLVLMFKLIEKDIPVEVHEDEVKEFINDLRFLFSQDELRESLIYQKDIDFFSKIRSRNIYFIEQKAKKYVDKQERDDFITEESDLVEAKIKFIQKQLSIHTETKTIDGLLKKIELLISGGTNAVKLSTIHRAKGLENDVVFILNYDKLPLSRVGQKEWEKVQENNLKYVALTRTKISLYLVNAEEIGDDTEQESLFDTFGDIW